MLWLRARSGASQASLKLRACWAIKQMETQIWFEKFCVGLRSRTRKAIPREFNFSIRTSDLNLMKGLVATERRSSEFNFPVIHSKIIAFSHHKSTQHECLSFCTQSSRVCQKKKFSAGGSGAALQNDSFLCHHASCLAWQASEVQSESKVQKFIGVEQRERMSSTPSVIAKSIDSLYAPSSIIGIQSPDVQLDEKIDQKVLFLLICTWTQ